ncbi:lysine 2,3-aminomutase [Halalkalibacter wakoensis JCM 9140]|uniref:Lysine 2,3-aminomutase n=1 Tax=Halalkalibacter wakoensis JCM 9140 TaxID=1236970 RepID=W4PYY4_9BACI|nr:lysine 2,3-aminomutase [Halalkalibacter wakoensis JCM 9140]
MLHLRNDVPTFVVDAPGGGGKITLQPNYMISQSPEKVVLRNFEGVITTYPEPKGYVPGRADDYFSQVYQNYQEKQSNTGISSLLNDEKNNLVPHSLDRYIRRSSFQEKVGHITLKDKRVKRDELKEKKYQAEMKKYTTDPTSDDTKGV